MSDSTPAGGSRRLLRATVVAVVLAAACWALAREWPDVASALAHVRGPYVVAAGGGVLLALGGSLAAWRAVLAGLGSPLTVPVAARILYVGQLGKYLPGSIWPVLTQMELARDHGVPPVRTAAAALLWTGITVLTGAVVGAAGVAQAARHHPAVWLVLLAVPAGLAGLHAAVLGRAQRLAARLLRRDPPATTLPPRAVAVAAAWCTGTWLAYGGAAALLTVAVASPSMGDAMLAIPAYALATVAGLLVLPVPAGAGVREVVLVGTLSPGIGAPAATAVALLARVLVTAADLLVGASAAFAARRLRGVPVPGPPAA